MRRSGSRFIARVKSSAVKSRLKRFLFNIVQAYIIELAEQVMRFYRHQAQITCPDSDCAITNGQFTSDITGWDDRSTGTGSITHDATNGRMNLIPGGTGPTDIGWAEQSESCYPGVGIEQCLKFRVLGAPGDKIEFQVGTATLGSQTLGPVEKEVGWHVVSFTPTTSPFFVQFRNLGSFRNKTVQIDDVSLINDSAVEVDTPWTETELFDVEGPQSADVLYQFHDSTATYKLQRFGHTTWSLVEVAWVDGPYLDENTTSTTLTPSATTGLGIDLTLSSINGVNDNQGWLSTDIGRLVRYKGSAIWGYAIIVSITSTIVAVADVRKDFDAITSETTWRLGAWSSTTGYPQTGSFFEQRLYMAATTDQPQTLWASQTADFENMKPDNDADTIEADDAINRTLSAEDVNAIRWLSAGEDTLVIGTHGGEWVPTSAGEVLTAVDITVRRQTKHGSARIQPVRIGNTVLFVQRAKRKIRQFGLAFDPGSGERVGFRAPDVTRLAKHITKGGIVEMDYAEEAESIVWAVRNDGQLLSMTFRREEDVVGWARHILGGVDDNLPFDRVWHVDDSADTFVDETTDANDSFDNNWTPFPASEAVGDYALFGSKNQYSEIRFDYTNGQPGVGGVVVLEYWNGTAWTAHTDVIDNTNSFTAAAADFLTVSFTRPTDWVVLPIEGTQSLFYTRARITTAYTTNPILDQGFIQGDAVVESVAVIPGADGSGQTKDSSERDEVWITVRRTINNAQTRFIEVFELDFETGDDQEDAYYADSLITFDGARSTALSGYDHLEAETGKVWADGAIQADKTVASGNITIDTGASVVQFGLPFRHKLKTLKGVGGNPAGTRLGKTQRIHGLTFVLLNSHTISFGPDSVKLTEKDFRVVSDPMDAGAPLFTGERFVEFEGDWETDARIVIESSDPTPFTILALAPEISLNPLK